VRNLVILLVLLVLFLLAGQVLVLVQDWHFVVPADSGQLLYVTTFDDSSADWIQYQGRLSAQVMEAALRLDVGLEDSLPFSTAAPYFEDFDLLLRARPIAGPLDNAYGVVFRMQDTDNYYMFLISSDGYYQVQRNVNGQQKKMSDWIPSSLIKPGMNVDNWLRVVALDDSFRFYINGAPVDLCIPTSISGESTYAGDRCVDGEMQPRLIDAAITYGQVGVVAQSFDERGVVVDFDDLVIYGPRAVA
jgi:hypothetical protein